MREYEATIVLSNRLDDDGVNKVVGQVTDLLGRQGGAVTSVGQIADRKGNVAEASEGWKSRKLAYTIGGHHEGYYVILRFQAPAAAPEALEKWLKLNEHALRFLVLRTDED